jgi:hypothetical protein
MGCDIHLFIERKRATGSYEDMTNYNYDPEYYDEYDIHFQPNEKTITCRNYYLFSQLASVRNYNELKPISEPKGIPLDVSPYIRKHYEHWVSVAHSASWLTAKEIKNRIEEIKKGYFKDIVLSEETQDTSSLEELLINLEVRYKQYTYEKDLTDEDYENIRIVFWFDN